MSTNPSSTPDADAAIYANFERLDRALDEALKCESPAPARRKRNAPLPFSNRFGEFKQPGSSKILSAMCSKLLADHSLGGAIEYHELKAKCHLREESFGLALTELIPSHLVVQREGDNRYYKLRPEIRKEILALK